MTLDPETIGAIIGAALAAAAGALGFSRLRGLRAGPQRPPLPSIPEASIAYMPLSTAEVRAMHDNLAQLASASPATQGDLQRVESKVDGLTAKVDSLPCKECPADEAAS
jgi:hypothetical protein